MMIFLREYNTQKVLNLLHNVKNTLHYDKNTIHLYHH